MSYILKNETSRKKNKMHENRSMVESYRDLRPGIKQLVMFLFRFGISINNWFHTDKVQQNVEKWSAYIGWSYNLSKKGKSLFFCM